MCFGVRDAISLARARAAAGSVTVLGDLVHNDTVLDDLRARGVRLENRLENVATRAVLITAHGASQRAMERARLLGHSVEEATCPLVHYAHRAMAQLVAEGFYPVIIGQRNHVEVRGVTEDLEDFSVILMAEEVAMLPEKPRYGIIAQTTQPLARAEALVALVKERFPAAEVRFVDTICRPTKQRQQAAHDLARQSDVVVVIGGAHSNNTRELAAACERDGARVHHVQTADDLRSEWFQPEDTVGLTAGTSTPDEIIDAVEARLRQWAEEAAITWTVPERTAALAVH
jgi:4-hydroxy-3-methylbut-2-enyl diphosphate reductase